MSTFFKIFCYFIFGMIILMTFFPFVFMIITSFKTVFQFYQSFLLPAFPLHVSNYFNVIGELAPYILNSIIVTLISVTGIVFLGALSGFIFARFHFPGKQALYYGIISLMMVPWILTLIPSFSVVKNLGLLDSYWVMILPYIAGGQVMAIYIFRSFFSTLPEELFETARIDGAGYLKQFWYIGAALSRPVFGLIGIISSLSIWNNFIWPLVTTSSDEVTVLTVGIMRFYSSYSPVMINYGEMFAGYTIASLPLLLLFLVATKQFMKGITSGALKA